MIKPLTTQNTRNTDNTSKHKFVHTAGMNVRVVRGK